jgi:hypothetical protein
VPNFFEFSQRLETQEWSLKITGKMGGYTSPKPRIADPESRPTNAPFLVLEWAFTNGRF